MLVRQASAVARQLSDAGIRPGDHVAVLSDASTDHVACVYGILFAGAVVIPLNAGARAEELQRWIVHGEARVLLADKAHPEVATLLTRLEGVTVLLRDRHSVADANDAAIAHCIERRPEQLAAMLYTSGTTGQPKAVMLSHGNLAANTDAIVSYLQLSRGDSVVSVMPFHYAYGSSVLHTHLAVGGRVIIEPNLVYPHRVLETIARESATGFAGVPSTFALIAARVSCEKYDLASLRYLTQAGGPMTAALTARVRKQFPRADLFLMYGQTEATARLTYVPPSRLEDKAGSVGIAIPGVEIQIRDAARTPLPAGMQGDVWARGGSIMLGYWKDATATAATLVDGWLCTGDAGSLDTEGFLFLAGRRSDIIKVGAHRVFPRDIEDVIVALDGVTEAAVVGVEDELTGEAVKACIVIAAGVTLDELIVKQHCRSRLAAYKIPRFIEFRDSLPKTANGKVRRQLLALPSQGSE